MAYQTIGRRREISRIWKCCLALAMPKSQVRDTPVRSRKNSVRTDRRGLNYSDYRVKGGVCTSSFATRQPAAEHETLSVGCSAYHQH